MVMHDVHRQPCQHAAHRQVVPEAAKQRCCAAAIQPRRNGQIVILHAVDRLFGGGVPAIPGDDVHLVTAGRQADGGIADPALDRATPGRRHGSQFGRHVTNSHAERRDDVASAFRRTLPEPDIADPPSSSITAAVTRAAECPSVNWH